jgi:hypothetical protein
MSQSASGADSTGESPPRRFGCFTYACLFLLVLGIGLSFCYRFWQSSASKELKAEMDRIRGRGEPLWFSELAPPEIEPSQDGTQLFLAALGKFQKPTPAFTTLVAPDPPAPPTAPGTYPEFESVLEANRPAMELIARAVQRPYFRLPINYRTRQPFSILLQPIQDAREISWLWTADVLQSIGTGDHERAVAADLECFGLAELLRDEPFLITQLVRIAIAGQAIHSLETIVSHIELTPEQFQAVDETLERMEARLRLAQSVRCERAMLLTGMDSIAENPEDLGMIANGSPAVQVLSLTGMGPLRLRDEAFMLRLMSGFADVVDAPGPDGKSAIRQFEASLQPSFQHVLSRLLAPTILPAREAAMRLRQRLVNARIGIRLQRFRIAHGNLPQSLDDLIDDKLLTIPNDLYSGKPPIFRALPDGFVVYSVGDNGSDDGGGEQPDQQEHETRFEVHR